ncbi:pyridoxal-phosphate dependent enzyme [Luteimonas sp. RD2P54]|uniref:Pyridoxal-phosphate dependent enzyme n=1 Tax=Luteimonas endophytica TaxID=3042023 RepID=A0ABT6J6X8_9GAMM|nr:pyridoxal-phosphate dependent enzyme [Luteimonas endophytica]MDH5821948.1 pyridoxal-phosphate dependent enzyme [Luteimonas endophytica]
MENPRPTRLVDCPGLARAAGVRRVLAKCEWERPLGNFKSLGGMLAGLRALARAVDAESIGALLSGPARPLPRLLCASDGNHGLAVAAAAACAGTRAEVYLPRAVPALRAARITSIGGEVAWVDGTYDDAVLAAVAAAAAGDALLIPDTSPDPEDPVVRDVIDGYRVMTDEIAAQLDLAAIVPSHLFVQAGVGGLAAAMAATLHARLRDPARLVVVEPADAACVAAALQAGAPVRIEGGLHTAADMLACGLASASAVPVLRAHDARSLLVNEGGLEPVVALLWTLCGIRTTASGAAGVAGLLHAAAPGTHADRHGLGPDSEVLLVITEGAAGV